MHAGKTTQEETRRKISCSPWFLSLITYSLNMEDLYCVHFIFIKETITKLTALVDPNLKECDLLDIYFLLA